MTYLKKFGKYSLFASSISSSNLMATPTDGTSGVTTQLTSMLASQRTHQVYRGLRVVSTAALLQLLRLLLQLDIAVELEPLFFNALDDLGAVFPFLQRFQLLLEHFVRHVKILQPVQVIQANEFRIHPVRGHAVLTGYSLD